MGVGEIKLLLAVLLEGLVYQFFKNYYHCQLLILKIFSYFY